MKKITFKIFTLILTFVAFQINAQAWNGTAGTYRIVVQGTNLALTLPNSTAIANGEAQELTYQPVKTTDNTQIFIIQPVEYYEADGSTLVASAFSITPVLPNKGVVQILNNQLDSSPIGCKNNDFGVAGGLDVWNPTRGTGTQIFSENRDVTASFNGKAKRRLQTSGEGLSVKIGGGTPVAFDFIPASPVLSTNNFQNNSFVIYTSKNKLNILGETSEVANIAIYSILGSKVISSAVKTQSNIDLDISSLSKGMYIVEIMGKNGRLTKKIVKE